MMKKLLSNTLVFMLSFLAQDSLGQEDSAKNHEAHSDALKRFEVDGVAVGDPMDEVLRKWGLDAPEIKIEKLKCLQKKPLSRTEQDYIGAKKYRQFLLEWNEQCPRHYRARKGKRFQSDIVATFNHEKLLGHFIVRKKYDGNFDQKDIVDKLIDKYGSPIDDEGNPKEVEYTSAQGDKLSTLSLRFYRGKHEGAEYGFGVGYKQTHTEAILTFAARDDYLLKKEPRKVAEELKEQLWKQYSQVEEKKDAAEIEF